MRLSVIVPVYNEAATVRVLLERVLARPEPAEVVVVDDASTDGTADVLAALPPDPRLRCVRQPHNAGKGAAVRRGFSEATGDWVLVQDADLELDPAEYAVLVAAAPLSPGAVYGSRFLRPRRGFPFATTLGNRVLSLWTSLLFRTRVSDMETCFKLLRRDLALDLGLTAERFDFEPQVTGLLLRRGAKPVEVPVSYRPRGREAGKKLHWRDGFVALEMLVRIALGRPRRGAH